MQFMAWRTEASRLVRVVVPYTDFYTEPENDEGAAPVDACCPPSPCAAYLGAYTAPGNTKARRRETRCRP